MPEHPLVGTWNLVSSPIINEEGVKIGELLGPNPRGLLIYTDNGFMSAHLMSASRPQCKSNLLDKASSEEKVLAFNSSISYCGAYEILEDRVIHHVMASFFPNWVGTDLVRVIQLDGDLLTLTAPPITSKGSKVQAIWRRLDTNLQS